MSDAVSGCTRPRTTVTEAEVEALVHGICFKTGPPRRLGVEVEWLVHELCAPRLPVSPERLEAVYPHCGPCPWRSALTVEPGGQLELSSLPAASPHGVHRYRLRRPRRRPRGAARGRSSPSSASATTLARAPPLPAAAALRRHGGLPRPLRSRRPLHDVHLGLRAGVSVDAGHEEPGPLGHVRRWWLAHQLGAVLLAAFANSPLAGGRPTGWRSTWRCAGRRSAPAGRAVLSWTPTRAAPGRGTSWTRR